MKLQEIKDIIDNYAGEDIAKKTHHRDLSDLRSIFNYCAFKYADQYISHSVLGRFLDRNHATVINSIKNFYEFYETDKKFKRQADIIIDIVKTSKESEHEPDIKIDDYSYIKLLSKYKKNQKTCERYNSRIAQWKFRYGELKEKYDKLIGLDVNI